jgi:hypothetical protein
VTLCQTSQQIGEGVTSIDYNNYEFVRPDPTRNEPSDHHLVLHL